MMLHRLRAGGESALTHIMRTAVFRIAVYSGETRFVLAKTKEVDTYYCLPLLFYALWNAVIYNSTSSNSNHRKQAFPLKSLRGIGSPHPFPQR